jgi:ATP-binding cassette subfamily A (ABC1) protein 1
MLLYGPSIAAFTYMWSFLFKSHSTAQNVMIIVYIFTGVLLAMVSFILDAIDSTKGVNSKLKFLYRLLPNFCFGESIINLISRASTINGTIRGTWDMDVVGWPCLYMFLETVVYFGIVMLIEKILATPALLSYFVRGQQVTDPPHADDEDVAAEKVRLQPENTENKDVVKVRGLRKEFHFWSRPAKVAVKDMWFGIHEGECFGFLGINGAGKTTTLQMLTGAEYPTLGAATLKGFDIMTQQQELRRHMGYCPQFDALIETLTGRETLFLYARIKGVPEAKVGAYVNAMIQRIGLTDYADRPCGGYSGGNKRKLSVGVALIGNPSVIFLDEPSTGMDPGAKRFMWDLIAATNAGRSLILTTHSLEEAEALCHRIGIMVSGRLRCLGSAQHLRSRYGQGYQIELKTEDKEACVSALRKWMEGTFEGAQLVEIHGDRLKYKINRSISLGGVFGEIERNKQALSIQEYSCAEYSLEQIFIHFAKQQEEEQGAVAGVVGSGQ